MFTEPWGPMPDSPHIEEHPLKGRTAVVVASPEKTGKLRDGLASLGADVLPVQVCMIRGVQDTAPLDAALRILTRYRWILFTSAYGVQFFYERLNKLGLGHLSTEIQGICAIGPATAARLQELGFKVALVPKEFVSEGILSALAELHGGAEHLRGVRILLPRAREGRALLLSELSAAGALVDAVPCYESVPVALEERVKRRITDRPPDLVVFTSPSNVRNFVDAWDGREGRSILETSVIAALGPVTAAAVRLYGKEADIQPEANTIASLLEAVKRHYVLSVRPRLRQT